MTSLKFFSKIICSAILAALVFPQVIFAQNTEDVTLQELEGKIQLSKYDTQTIFHDLLPKALTDTWISQFVYASSDHLSPSTALILREFIRYDFSNYLLTEVPLNTAKFIITQGIEVWRIANGDKIFSGVLEKFEKDSVGAAVNYAKNEFFKYQTKVASGAFEVNYRSEGGKEKAAMQYVVFYKNIDNEKADVSIAIYSTESINPPQKGMSAGGMSGVMHDFKPGEKLPPFIATFSGEIMIIRAGGTAYSWIGQPVVEISFPSVVPDFGLRPKSWWQRNIVEPLQSFFKNPLAIFGASLVTVSSSGTVTDLQNGEAWQIDAGETSGESQTSSQPSYNILPIDDWAGQGSGLDDLLRQKEEEDGAVTSTVPFTAPNILYTVPAGPVTVTNQNGAVTLSPEEAIRQALLELIRRQQANGQGQQGQQLTEEERQEQEELRQNLINVIGELQRRNGQAGQVLGVQDEISEGSENDDSGNDENDDDDLAQDDQNDQSENITVPTLCAIAPEQSAKQNKIIINEVAWMGTAASSNHEWIELKNLTNQTIDLFGWQMQDKDRQVKIIFGAVNQPGQTAQLGAGQFFLLERTDDDAVPGIAANAIYSGALGNSNEALYLFDSDCQLQDKVQASPSWPAGNETQKRTMERGADLSWHSYAGVGQNNIFGTPKAANGPAGQQSGTPTVGSGSGGSSAGGGASGPQQEPVQDEPVPPEQTSPVSEPQAIGHLIISEFQAGDAEGKEYVELYNPTDQEINLCASAETAFYFAYYSANRDWHDPYRAKSFCDAPDAVARTIAPKGYYLIGFNGYPQSDWPMYPSKTLSDISGAVAIFSANPDLKSDDDTVDQTAAKVGQVKETKIDAVGWKKTAAADEPIVKETGAVLVPSGNLSLGRLWHNATQKYQDTDDNSKDFVRENPSPKDQLSFAPEAISDLAVEVHPQQRNGAKLSWSAPVDPDTLPGQMNYQIFYSRDQQPLAANLKKIEEETTPLITKEEGRVIALVPDLFYGSAYYFVVQAADESGNLSPLSTASPAFDIQTAQNPWPMAYHDPARTNQGEYGGPLGNKSLNDLTGLDPAGLFLMPPAIGDGNSAYVFARVAGQNGLYAFDNNGQQKWQFPVSSHNQIPAIGDDGSVYFLTSSSVGALSPGGKLKWEEHLAEVYSEHLLLGPASRLYVIAKKEVQDGFKLLALADSGDRAVKTFEYDLSQEVPAGQSISTVFGPTLDSENNIYLSVNQKLIKLNSQGQKIGERSFGPEFAEDYEGPRDITVEAGVPYLFDNNAIILGIKNGHCAKLVSPGDPESFRDGCESTVYSVSSNDLAVDNWKISANFDFGRVGGNKFYYNIRAPGMFGASFLDLVAIDLATGDRTWSKHWASSYTGPDPIYPLLSDSQGYAYFGQREMVLGYDMSQPPDSDPGGNLVFSANISSLAPKDKGAALGLGTLYLPNYDKLSQSPCP
ncbi:MAG: lamin tail domain-containing protein [Candidatus Paceibacterota bacterium]|jgi:uncharacterized membrane protein YgcG